MVSLLKRKDIKFYHVLNALLKYPMGLPLLDLSRKWLEHDLKPQ